MDDGNRLDDANTFDAQGTARNGLSRVVRQPAPARAAPPRWKGWRRLAGVALVVCLLGAATFALPVPSWRSGHDDWSRLVPLEAGQREPLPRRVWIDTDAACGTGRWRDPDDCLALLAILRRAELDVVGVSTVFGNAPLDVTDATTRELVARVVAAGGKDVPVHRGCAQATPHCASGPPAVQALRRAAEAGPLTVLALGPLTNVAAALGASGAMHENVHVVAVMGRRPGHRFHPTEGRSATAMLFGHGPVFGDLNFALDPQAAAALLASGVAVTLVPYEAARSVLLTEADLERIARGGTPGAWVAARSRGWLEHWRRWVGRDGFMPFDLVAAMAVIAQPRLDCARVLAWVGRDHRRLAFERAEALLVAQDEPPDVGVDSVASAVYCTDAHLQVADVL